MRIAILGTRGIPNRYGGFERFAEEISKGLVKLGHEVFITKPSNMNSQVEVQPGVISVCIQIPSFLPENTKTVIYDYRSLLWADKENIDVAIECGHSFSPLLFLLSKRMKAKIITNPDGLEYQRSKWGLLARIYLKMSEHLAFKHSAAIVCDNRALLDYYKKKYGREMYYIPYGAYPLTQKPDINLVKQHIPNGDYYLIVARLTPENNIVEILNAFKSSGRNCLVVGEVSKGYPMKIFRKYSKFSNIRFLGAIYDQSLLNSLRFYCKAYIHGHSVGGTNPSLLEAMACGCFIIAHDNPFNRDVLGSEALYFHNSSSLLDRLNEFEDYSENEIERVKKDNIDKIENFYTWDSVSAMYSDIINQVINRRAT